MGGKEADRERLDLLALACQTEITPVATFMLAKELSNAVYPRSSAGWTSTQFCPSLGGRQNAHFGRGEP